MDKRVFPKKKRLFNGRGLTTRIIFSRQIRFSHTFTYYKCDRLYYFRSCRTRINNGKQYTNNFNHKCIESRNLNPVGPFVVVRPKGKRVHPAGACAARLSICHRRVIITVTPPHPSLTLWARVIRTYTSVQHKGRVKCPRNKILLYIVVSGARECFFFHGTRRTWRHVTGGSTLICPPPKIVSGFIPPIVRRRIWSDIRW